MSDEYERTRRPRTARPSSRLRPINTAAENTLQSTRKIGSSLSPRRQSKRRAGRSISIAHRSSNAPSCYQPWKPEYSQVILRDKQQKTMTKESYKPSTNTLAQAKESIATEEECRPGLILPNAVHSEQITIQYRTKPLLPTIVRYVRMKELLPSEQSMSLTTQQTTTDRILDRAQISDDPSVIRRPPRRLTNHTLFPLTLYD